MVLSREYLEDEITKSKIAIDQLEKGVFINKIVLERLEKELVKYPEKKKKINSITQ